MCISILQHRKSVHQTHPISQTRQGCLRFLDNFSIRSQKLMTSSINHIHFKASRHGIGPVMVGQPPCSKKTQPGERVSKWFLCNRAIASHVHQCWPRIQETRHLKSKGISSRIILAWWLILQHLSRLYHFPQLKHPTPVFWVEVEGSHFWQIFSWTVFFFFPGVRIEAAMPHELTVNILNGDAFTLDVTSIKTVQQLKCMLCEKFYDDPIEQKILKIEVLKDSDLLKDAQTLNESGLRAENGSDCHIQTKRSWSCNATGDPYRGILPGEHPSDCGVDWRPGLQGLPSTGEGYHSRFGDWDWCEGFHRLHLFGKRHHSGFSDLDWGTGLRRLQLFE